MSTVRWKKLPPFRQDRFGFYLCRLCSRACPEGERQWCSQDCLRQFLILSHGSFVRAQLFERDQGVCAECGVDGGRMDAALGRLKADLLHPLLMSIHPLIITTLRSEGWSNVKRRGSGPYADALKFSSCWEAHHADAVVEGGGECGLENYRTLCFICHKKTSADQARLRAQRRRLKKRELKNALVTPPANAGADQYDIIPF